MYSLWGPLYISHTFAYISSVQPTVGACELTFGDIKKSVAIIITKVDKI